MTYSTPDARRVVLEMERDVVEASTAEMVVVEGMAVAVDVAWGVLAVIWALATAHPATAGWREGMVREWRQKSRGSRAC